MRRVMVGLLAVSLSLGACATKRYGRMTELSDPEREGYTCRELAIEVAKVRAFQDQVAKGARIDWRSVAGFLGDYGIGNAMERADAEKSAQRRLDALMQAEADKKCLPNVSLVDRIVRLWSRAGR